MWSFTTFPYFVKQIYNAYLEDATMDTTTSIYLFLFLSVGPPDCPSAHPSPLVYLSFLMKVDKLSMKFPKV